MRLIKNCVYECPGCGCVFGQCYLGESYNYVLPYMARIEVPPEAFETILNHRETISKTFHALGFIYVSLDLDGFKSGSLNKVLTRPETLKDNPF